MAFHASGTGQPVGELAKKASVEFIVAVNERIDVLRSMQGRAGLGTYANGANDWATGNFPVYGDLAGKPLESWRDDCLAYIRASIASICTYFVKSYTTSPAGIVFYSGIADLLGAGSFGATWVSPVRPQTANAYLQVKEALENLTIVSGFVDVWSTATNISRLRHEPRNSVISIEVAWDLSQAAGTNLHNYTFYSDSIVYNCFHWYSPTFVPGSHYVIAAVNHSLEVTIDTLPVGLTDTHLFYHHDFWIRDRFDSQPRSGMSATDNQGGSSSVPLTLAIAPLPFDTKTEVWVAKAPCITGTNTLFVLSWTPADHPWVDDPPPSSSALAFGLGKSMYPIGDLSSLMTYG